MKKVVSAILAVLLVLAFFAGTAAAFELNSSSVNPNGALAPGDSVTAVANIKIPGGTGPSLGLSTPLTKAAWHINIMRGSVKITELDGGGSLYSISSWSLNYDEDISLEISMTGLVDNNLAGKSIIVMTITQDKNAGAGLTTYSTPAQSVYNPADITTSVANLRAQIALLKEQAQYYANYGINVDSANNSIASAESYLNSAESYGSSNIKAAFKALDNADAAVKSAGNELSAAALSRIAGNIDATNMVIASLIEKGKTNEANIISTKLMEVKTSYNTLSAEYNNRNMPDCREALGNSENVLAQANDFLEKANSGIDILKYWWVLLIILGVAAVVVVVVVIVKHRGNGWDELG